MRSIQLFYVRFKDGRFYNFFNIPERLINKTIQQNWPFRFSPLSNGMCGLVDRIGKQTMNLRSTRNVT